MVNRFQSWVRQLPATLKVALVLPLLLLAVLWSAWPGADGRTPDSGNRPVLRRDGAPATGSTTAAGGTAVPAASAPAAPAVPAAATSAGTTSAGTEAAERPVLPPHQEPRLDEAGISWGSALRTLVSVAVVIVLILISARLLKYFMASGGQLVASGNGILVLETAYLPAPSGRGRSALHLVEVADRLLLVGATDAQLTLLGEFDQEPAVTRPAPPADPPSPTRIESESVPTFTEALAAIRAGGAEDNGSAAGPNGRQTNGPAGGQTIGHANGHDSSGLAAVAPDRSDGHALGQAELAEMLRRLRDSKRRIEGSD